MVGWGEKTRGNGDLTVILPTDVGLQPSKHTMLVTNDSGNLLSHFNPPIQPLQITNMIDHHLTGEDVSPCFLLFLFSHTTQSCLKIPDIWVFPRIVIPQNGW